MVTFHTVIRQVKASLIFDVLRKLFLLLLMEKEVKDTCGSTAQRKSINSRSKERGLICTSPVFMSLTSLEIAERDDIIQLLCSLGHCLDLADLCHYLAVMGLLGGTYRVSTFLNQQKC